MKTHSFQAQSIEGLKQGLEKKMSEEFQATLAIVFSSISFSFSDITTVFDQYQIDLVGCSSAGGFAQETVIDKGIVVLLMDIKKEQYQILSSENQESTYQTAFEMGQTTKKTFHNPALLLFSGGMKTDGEKLLIGIKDGFQGEFPIYGGLAADDLQLSNTSVFSNNWECNDGLLGLVIDTDKIQVKGLAVSGWEKVGTLNTITKAEGNVVYEINNEPALDFFIKYFGFFNNICESNIAVLETISGQYPLQILREGGYSIMRSPMVADEKKRSLMLAGGVKSGEQFHFSISPGFEVMEQSIKEFGTLKEEFSDADAMVLVSCKARHTVFGPLIETELDGIRDYWDCPMVGFFSYGEIGKGQNAVCDFHNVTSSLVLMKEIEG